MLTGTNHVTTHQSLISCHRPIAGAIQDTTENKALHIQLIKARVSGTYLGLTSVLIVCCNVISFRKICFTTLMHFTLQYSRPLFVYLTIAVLEYQKVNFGDSGTFL